jgi:cytochrome b561
MSEIADAVSQDPILRYSRLAVALHWLTAALLVAQVVVGFTFHRVLEQGPQRAELFTWHKTLGATILVIALLRLLYRWMNPPPPFPPELPKWERLASVWTHRAFYLLLIIVPLTGLIAVSDRPGVTTPLVGGIPLPTVPGINEATGDLSGEIHRFLVYATLLLLVAHIIAPLWHRFILRDRTTARMPPFRDPAGEPAVIGQGGRQGEG